MSTVVLFGCFSQCYLAKSGANLVLSRANGVLLTINAMARIIPSAGVTLAPTSLTPGTTYNIYAYMNGDTMTLEASTTGWIIDADVGLPVKSGDATRTLVGMARCVSGPAWQDGGSQIFVLSYFNRRKKTARNGLIANVTTGSTSFVEASTTYGRTEWLSWADDSVSISSAGSATATTNTNPIVGLGVDGTTAIGATVTLATSELHTAPYCVTTNLNPGDVTAGYHYGTILIAVNGPSSTGLNSGSDNVPPNYQTGIETSVMG